MTISTSKKVAAAKAKPTTTKPSKTLKKNQRTTQNSQSQASVTSSSRSKTLRHVSVSDEEEDEPTHVGGVLDADSENIMELSDGKEGTTGTTKILQKRVTSQKVRKMRKQNFVRLSPGLRNDKLNLEQQDGCRRTG